MTDARHCFPTVWCARKIYLARAASDPALVLPCLVRGRIVKHRGNLQGFCKPGVPNAETLVELISSNGLCRLTPHTGRPTN
ncbi:hypothetical protein A8144_00585 [Mycobacterium leprae 3125609]|nr:hypothetical protein A8144_00585 [Mycobacterium leprae 3125609]OAX72276.1 hypothetical protein A3216_00650 [Mycobacterium leprae 7935681]